MNAIRTVELGRAEVQAGVSIPDVPSGYVLLKTSCVALNPSDWKHIDHAPLFKPGHTLGFDVCGTIVKIGDKCPRPWQIGERVAGASWGCRTGSPDSGSFAEYCLVKSHLAISIPGNYTDAQAATLAIGCLASHAALYRLLNFPWPDQQEWKEVPPALLIYGGSTATGLTMIQFAKLSGLRVVATCSPRNFEKVTSAGADAVFDYADPELCAKEIRAFAEGKLTYAVDCVANESSAAICAQALRLRKGSARYVSLLPVDLPRYCDDLTADTLVVFPAWGEDVLVGDVVVFAADQGQAHHADRFLRLVEVLLQQGKIKTCETLRDGGLQAVLAGLDDMRHGSVSGEKLVYRV